MPKCKDCKDFGRGECAEVGADDYNCGAFKPIRPPITDGNLINDNCTCTVRYADGKPVHDAVNHPTHYTQGGIECIDALDAATAGLTGIEAVCTANAIKYLWRWKHKNGVEDLRKAVWYIERLIGKAGGKT